MSNVASEGFDYRATISDIEKTDEELKERLLDNSFNPDEIEYKEGDEAIKIVSGGFIKIADEKLLVKILLADGNNESNIPYSEIQKMYAYTAKMGEKMLIKILKMHNWTIPQQEFSSIVNYALYQAIKDSNPNSKTSFSSFFFTKILGEVTNLNRKNKTTTQSVYSSVNDNSDLTNNIVIETKEGSNGTTYGEAIALSHDNPEDSVVEDDLRRRQLKAFRMAFSGIPRNLQILLYNFVNGVSLKELAPIFNLSERELMVLRDRAVSLLLQRVIRSSHITDEEKLDILKMQGLADDDVQLLSEVLDCNYRNIDKNL